MAAFQDSSLKKLQYTIHKCSSYSSTYSPEHILENNPSDQSSRWSSDTNNPPQYLILKLQKFSIVKSISFGKYEKTHVCNVKKFKIYGGLTEDNMIELLEGGLRNDTVPETFPLQPVAGTHLYPCRYIKIMPIQSWGPSFNFSIWYVELQGKDNWDVVRPSLEWFHSYRNEQVVRACLKFFRQMDYKEAYHALQRQSQVQLEDPLMTELHDILVNKGDFEGAELFMEKCITTGMFNQFINNQEYRPHWKPMQSDDSDIRPGMRGGHQMCIDPYSEIIYLFGGWDGNQDLSDFWSYHIPSRKWKLIAKDTEAEGGPTARSCHKMCLDPERKQIFTLGRYLDMLYRTPENLKSDFYMYDIESNRWTLISEDTGSVGGPQLIFDHQMSLDVEKRTIYVFGGRVLTPASGLGTDERPNSIGLVGATEPTFSGLFSYHVPTNTWTKLCDDSSQSNNSNIPTIRSRVGHSMLFHPGCRKLYIFSGQRSKEFLNDFFTYNVDTHEVNIISEDSKKEPGNMPAAGFTQRATIDPELNEIYVLSGLSKDKEKRDDNVQNSFWVYFIAQCKWSCIYKNENTGEHYWTKMQYVEPCPRFAHQLVYDPLNKVHYLFGGNPGHSCVPKLRLDDFWLLRLGRPTSDQLLQKCKLLIRKFQLQEIASKNKMGALQYLQSKLSEVIDHDDPDQTKEFHLLASLLFQDQEENLSMIGGHKEGEDDCHHRRSQLFDSLIEFFPPSMTQPKFNLLDLIPL